MEGIISKDDPRYRYTEEYLIKKGFIFHDPSVDAKNLDFIIFPFKDNVNNALYDDKYFAALNPGLKIFSGVRNDYLTEQCGKNNLEYHVMMEVPCVVSKNAIPTSEGVIAYLISNRETTIYGSRILIMGYGVCGRDLAKRLKGLGADVYVLVRNKEKEHLARENHISPIYLNEIENTKFSVIINTIPNRILKEKTLQKLSEALIVDIASPPYGFDFEYIKKNNPKSTILAGIPCKYAVCSAGEILGEYIHCVLQS